jgi:hypothetical protein
MVATFADLPARSATLDGELCLLGLAADRTFERFMPRCERGENGTEARKGIERSPSWRSFVSIDAFTDLSQDQTLIVGRVRSCMAGSTHGVFEAIELRTCSSVPVDRRVRFVFIRVLESRDVSTAALWAPSHWRRGFPSSPLSLQLIQGDQHVAWMRPFADRIEDRIGLHGLGRGRAVLGHGAEAWRFWLGRRDYPEPARLEPIAPHLLDQPKAFGVVPLSTAFPPHIHKTGVRKAGRVD